ncbi:hypothetical protein ACWEFL_14665 [Streptomyces sp. NPDC004838]
MAQQRARSTDRANRLGGAALVSLGTAYLMAAVFWYEPAPRWSVLIPLGLAALLAAGWALVSRAAPPVPDPQGPLPVPAAPDTDSPPPIPAELPFYNRQKGAAASTFLAIWAPFFTALAVLSIAHIPGTDPDGPVVTALLLTGALGFLCLCAVIFWSEFLGRTVRPPYTRLGTDAAAGRVRAIRVRVDAAVSDLRPLGSRGRWNDVHGTYLALTPHEPGPDGTPGEELRFGPMQGMFSHRDEIARRHFMHSIPHLVGENAWLCWPKNWDAIHQSEYRMRTRVMPTVLVTDAGHIVWGRTGEHEWIPHLPERRAPLRQTDPGRTVAPAPRPSRYDPSKTPKLLLALAFAVLLTALCLTGTLTGWAAVTVALVLTVYIPYVSRRFAPYEGPGAAWWTVRDEEE